MKRKLINQRGSCTVTLPMDWVNHKNLKPGDDVDIDVEGGRVVIDSKINPALKSVTLEVPDKDAAKTIAGTAYRSGYSSITLLLNEKLGLAEIQHIIDPYIGLEVQQYSNDKIILRCFTPVDVEEYNFFVNKIFLSLKLMADELIGYMDKRELNYANILELRKNVLKARNYCMRAINIHKIARKSACDEYVFIHILEKIEGQFWHMGRYIKNNKPEPSDKLKEELIILKEIINKAYHTCLKRDFKSGAAILASRYKIRKEWLDKKTLLNLFKKKGVDPVLLSLIWDVRRRIVGATVRFLSTIIEESS